MQVYMYFNESNKFALMFALQTCLNEYISIVCNIKPMYPHTYTYTHTYIHTHKLTNFV